jgi:hypothetical protein
MQVNLHFVILEESADTAPLTTAGKNAVARISIIRECQSDELDFDDFASDTDPIS